MTELPVVVDDATGDVFHVVRVTVVGLTGITVDSSATIEVDKDKEMPAPPLQMKCVVAVMRDSETHGISALSRRLVLTHAMDDQENISMISQQQRYIAVWNTNKSIRDESVSFEMKLPLGKSTPRSMPHRNFELIVGLTTGRSSTATPIGAASLPVAEATHLRGSNGKVVLDLPVYNFASLTVNPFAKPSKGAVIPLAQISGTRRKLSLRRHEKKEEGSLPFDQEQKKKALGYNYSIDPSRDGAVLRVELEVHDKESNVEVGLVTEQTKPSRVVLLHSQQHAIETAHTVVHLSDSVNNIMCMEPSIERVLSADDETNKVATKTASLAANQDLPKRFRVKVVDQTTMDFELTPLAPKHVGEGLGDKLSTTNDVDEVRILDAAIERVLSMSGDEREEETTDQGAIVFAPSSPASSFTIEVQRSPSTASKSGSRPENCNDKTEKHRRMGPLGLLRKRRKSKKHSALTAQEPMNNLALLSEASPSKANENKSSTATSTASGDNAKTSSQQHLAIRNLARNLTSPVQSTQPGAHDLVVSMGRQQKQQLQPKQNSSRPSMAVARIFQVSRRVKNSDSSGSQSREPMLKDFYSSVTKATDRHVPDTSDSVSLMSHDAVYVASSTTAKTPPESLLHPPYQLLDDEWKYAVEADASTSSSPEFAYSRDLPNFSEEESILIIKEMFDDDIVHDKSTLQAEHFASSTKDQSLVARDIKQNLFGIMDLQPCAGKLDGLLADEEEDYSVADSWTRNDSSTAYTNKSRKESLHDDLAELGLLLGGLCRPSGFSGRDDVSEDETVSYREWVKESNASTMWRTDGTKQKRVSERLGAAVLRPFGNGHNATDSKHLATEGMSWTAATQDDEDDHGSDSSHTASGDSVSTEERTLDSENHDDDEVSEQGTEVDVKDVELASTDAPVVSTLAAEDREVSEKQPRRPSQVPSIGGQRNETTLQPSTCGQSMSQSSGTSKSLSKFSTENDQTGGGRVATTKPKEATTANHAAVNFIPKEATARAVNEVSSAKSFATKKMPPTGKAVLETPPKPIAGHDGRVERSRGSNSATDNQSPSNVMHPPIPVVPDSNLKYLTQSLVNLVGYVISPVPDNVRVSPTAFPSIPHVPSVLETHDTSSVGDLTATTYEMQVDIDELKRQIQLSELATRPPSRLVLGVFDRGDPPNDSDYFADYNQSSSGLVSAEVNAAVEAALAKKLAEGQR